MITVTFVGVPLSVLAYVEAEHPFFPKIRHGESMDNLKNIWAGWKDAPLSNHGMNQAQAMGEYFSTSTRYTAIYASPLKRAHSTAQALYAKQPSPQPSFTVSPLIQEQHFGIGEGHPWTFHADPKIPLEEHFKNGVFPVLTERDLRFPEGESLNDLSTRATQAINEHVMPHVHKCWQEGTSDATLALVSHGLCISELVAALLKKDKDALTKGPQGSKYAGLLNTAWTRVSIEFQAEQKGPTKDPLPPLIVKVTHVNQHSHLDKAKRQLGGIGSASHDPNQQDIRSFFGGGAAEAPIVNVEEGRSVSNVFDETIVNTDTTQKL